MIGRIFRSRGFRKFRRNRLALVAAVVIAAYAAVGVAVLCGAITRDESYDRVAPSTMPGFGGSQTPEKRFEDVDFQLTLLERAVTSGSPKEALAGVRLGRRRPADLPPAELKQRIEDAWGIYEEIEESENLNEDRELWPRLAALEEATASLWAPLHGWDRFAQGFLICCGTDRQGRSISLRAVYAIKVALQIGVVVGLVSVLFGSLVGAAAAYFGGFVDQAVQWLYSTLSAVPYLVLLSVLVFVFQGGSLENSLVPLYVALSMTFWIGPCRVIRGEVLKVKELDYVQAAVALGQGRLKILLKHIMPNVSHLMFVNFSLLFIAAIKSEVILTFLNLGVKNEPSWGTMISQSAQEVVNAFFWQIGAATAVMFVLVLAFNILTDALQDALDPKHIA